MQRFDSADEGFAIVPVYDFKTGGGDGWQELNYFEVYQTADSDGTWKKSVIDKTCDFTGMTFNLTNEVFYTLGWAAVTKFKIQ